ncbi:peptidoglycan-binding protein [Microbispora sp. RL4-1S]|uniref:Peptidoglycan-binding protein n=1 Tax=Microbispora oryzae TaxID=2806554 RepID=A0A940WSC5_9ACTN|nr:peptidoglycan-binding protein [Microbispora oryzae]MBP2706560.1 peptidoglycan-binding protein [Microbispora oryzae]
MTGAGSTRAAVAGVVVLALAGGGWFAAVRSGVVGSGSVRSGTPDAPAAAAAAIPTGVAVVERVDVTQSEQVNGTLTYRGAFTVQGGSGRLTRLPPVGSVVRRGAAVYEADGRKAILLYGSRPAWRPLTLGMTNGPDVRQLERNLRALGYTGFTVDAHFDLGTYYAVRRWQRRLRVPATGAITPEQVVFLPGPLRVTGYDRDLGAALGGPVLHGTGVVPVVSVQLDPTMVPTLRKGGRVTVTLPDGRARRGRVTEVSDVAVPVEQPDQQRQSYVPVTIGLSGRPPRVLDQALVQVTITTGRRRGVLAVPIVALLARPGGAFAVETIAEDGRRAVVPVETGMFDEIAGVVEVTGVAEGTRVEVPQQ